MTIFEQLQIIAALCSLHVGQGNKVFDAAERAESKQIQCHRYYAQCFKTKFDPLTCVINRDRPEIAVPPGMKKEDIGSEKL